MSSPLTASSVGRALQCPASHALPAAPEPRSDDATVGTAVHAWLDALVRGDLPATPTHPDAAALVAKIDRAQVPRGRAEVRFAYDVRAGTARELPPGAHRDYGDLAPTEIPGTVDALVEGPDGMEVIDWKTSRWAPHDAEGDRPQLWTYALMVARAYELDTVRARVVVVSETGATGTGAEWTLDTWALVEWATTLAALWERVRDLRAWVIAHPHTPPDVQEGAACRWCPADLACPAKRLAVAMLCAGVDPAAVLTGDSLGRAYLAVQTAEGVVDRVRAAVKSYVSTHGPVNADAGRVVKLDARGALRVVRGRAE